MFKKYIIHAIFALATLTQAVFAQSYCLKYNLAKSDPTTADFSISLTSGNAQFNLGAGNLQFRYNPKGLANPTIVSTALASGIYNGISLTKPQPFSLDTFVTGIVSINFDFTGSSGTGLTVNQIGTEVAVVRFQILDDNQTPNLRPYENGTAGTVVYNDNAANPALLSSIGNCLTYNERVPILNLKAYPTPQGAFITIFDRPSVTIDWSTTFEKRNTYYTIERSSNGRPFKPIASYLFGTYSFVDLNPLKASNKYRIKQIDPNGVETLSKEVEVVLDRDATFSIYPTIVTEANGYITLDVPNPYDPNQALWIIYNLQGKKMMRGGTGDRIDINVEKLPVGTYFMKIGDDVKKFVRQ